MTPFYDLNQIASIEDEEEEDYDHTSLFSYPTFFNTPQILQGSNIITNHQFDHEVVQRQLHHEQELMDHPINQGSNDTNYRISEQRSSLIDQRKSDKWMSSKTRIMKKMMNPRDKITTKKARRSKQLLRPQDCQQQQQQQGSVQASSNSSINNNCTGDGIVRVCSDCNTTKTPLWRSGPSGPKSLCNACGIRQRKARRALATAAAVNLGLIPSIMENKVRKLDIDHTIPFKKRCRFSTGSQKRICNSDDIVVRLSKSKAFHRGFPQDEKDAAILLMTLSCGLV